MFPIRGLDLPVFIVGIVFFFVYLTSRASARERDQKRRIELIERALQSGVVDDATKRELLAAVANDTWYGAHGRPSFLFGWIGLFVGIGLIILAMDDGELWKPAVIISAISFGVLSLPIAAREFHSRTREQVRGDVRP